MLPVMDTDIECAHGQSFSGARATHADFLGADVLANHHRQRPGLSMVRLPGARLNALHGGHGLARSEPAGDDVILHVTCRAPADPLGWHVEWMPRQHVVHRSWELGPHHTRAFSRTNVVSVLDNTRQNINYLVCAHLISCINDVQVCKGAYLKDCNCENVSSYRAERRGRQNHHRR